MPWGDAARGLAYEVRPLPMLAALLGSLAGALLAGDARAFPPQGLLVFLGLYAGHCMDSYIDYHVRGEPKFVYLGVFEDSGGLLGPRALLAAAGGSVVAFFAVLASLGDAGLWFLATALLGLAVALAYAPALDRNPWTVSAAYPSGVLLALLGGALLAARGAAVPLEAFAVGAVVWVYLVGGKVVSDLIDREGDAAMGKRTAVVALGPARAKRLGYLLCSAGLVGAAGLALAGLVPPGTLAGVAAAGAILAAGSRLPPARGTLVLVGAGYAWLLALLGSLALAPP